jgi:hypothetical protein
MLDLRRLWHDFKRLPVSHSVGIEVAVERENAAQGQSFGGCYDSGVC